jgi:preprotein translocase subunit SecD
MLYFARWKVILILVLCFLGIAYALPNALPPPVRAQLQQTLPSWMPTKTVNLGLDLQGGAHLLFQVDVNSVLRDRAEDMVNNARTDLREAKIKYTGMTPIENGMRVKILDGAQEEQARKVLRKLDSQLDIVATEDGKTLEARLNQTALDHIRDQTIEQSIEIVRRRIDETGTREPVIQRQGDDRIIVQLPGVDDPERIKDLIGRTAKLGFHLVDTDPAARPGAGKVAYPMVEGGRMLVVDRRAIITGEMLTSAQPTFQQGMPVVSFALDGMGTRRFCDVTTKNVNKPFAIVLDKQIISAPNIQSAICGGNAVITGGFSVQEANDLALLLRAGALPAPLHVLEERTVGPSLGADSVEAGKVASLYGLLLVIGYVVMTYGLFGVFASVALLLNVGMIFALLSGLQATLTLPGIAGIVLTIGMAVDANVLIFERIREEIKQGRSVVSAIDTGYNNAMSSIIDANLTTLISALILYSFGTGPIKGFAVTLSIGTVTSLFCAIMVTRLMVMVWLRMKRPATLKV